MRDHRTDPTTTTDITDLMRTNATGFERVVGHPPRPAKRTNINRAKQKRAARKRQQTARRNGR